MKKYLTTAQTIKVGNWLTENKEFVQSHTRKQIIKVLQDQLNITVSIHSIYHLCQELDIKLNAGRGKSAPKVTLNEIFILANDLRILAMDLGYGTTKEFNEVFNRLKKQLEEEN